MALELNPAASEKTGNRTSSYLLADRMVRSFEHEQTGRRKAWEPYQEELPAALLKAGNVYEMHASREHIPFLRAGQGGAEDGCNSPGENGAAQRQEDG